MTRLNDYINYDDIKNKHKQVIFLNMFNGRKI